MAVQVETIALLNSIEEKTWIHRLDSRVKLFFLVLFSLTTVFFGSPLFLISSLALVIFLLLASRPPRKVIRILFLYFYPATILLLGVLQALFFYRPESSSFFHPQGFFYGALQALRVLAITTAGVLVTVTTRAPRLMCGLKQIGMPDEICFLVSLVLRILPTILEETRCHLMAQRARGLKFRRFSFIKRLKALGHALEAVFLMALHSSHDIALAVDLRAFRASPQRTFTEARQMNRLDWLVLIVLGLGLMVLVAVGWVTGGRW